MPSYAAVLRRCAEDYSLSPTRYRDADTLRTLADLLERVTPELADPIGIVVPILRALAAGPQGEATT